MAISGMASTFKFTPAAGSETTLGKTTSIGEVAVTSNDIDTTTLDSTAAWREYIQGSRDGGEIALSCIHLKTDTGQVALRTAFASGVLCACVVTLPDTVHVDFSAYVKGWTIGPAEIDTAATFNATLKITGAVTVTVP